MAAVSMARMVAWAEDWAGEGRAWMCSRMSVVLGIWRAVLCGGEGVRLGVLRGPKGGNVDGVRVGGECVPHLGEHVGLGFAVLEKGGC